MSTDVAQFLYALKEKSLCLLVWFLFLMPLPVAENIYWTQVFYFFHLQWWWGGYCNQGSSAKTAGKYSKHLADCSAALSIPAASAFPHLPSTITIHHYILWQTPQAPHSPSRKGRAVCTSHTQNAVYSLSVAMPLHATVLCLFQSA